jgi:nickel-dependent lactate racemase
MLSECSEGLGSTSFVDVLKQLKAINDYDAFIERISHIENFIVDQWEVEELVKALKRVNIMLYSSDFDNFDLTFASRVASPKEGIARALEMHGQDASILAIPEGPYVIPYLSDGALSAIRNM